MAAKKKKTPTKKVAKKATKKPAKKATKKPAKKAAKKVAKKATKKAATKKVAKKAAKKVAKKAAAKKPAKTTPPTTHAILGSPPARTLQAPPSYSAAATLVPIDYVQRADVDDALDDAMGEAFDSLFTTTPPAAAAEPEPFVPGDPTLDLAQVCAALALDKKADDTVILHVEALTSYADYFVIAAAQSERQAQAIARTISDELRTRGRHPLTTDGLEQGNWVVLDYGSVVVHVFMEGARAYYDLDGFWQDAPRVEIDERRGLAALAAMGP